MNRLDTQTRAQILPMLVEGNSLRAISRMTGASINTVTKLLINAGKACAAYHHEKIRDVKAQKVQCDEIWSFGYAKAKNVKEAKAAPEGFGDVWTWTAIDADSKLILSYLVGGRDAGYALEFMEDVKSRLSCRLQLTTDGHKAYLEAVGKAFKGDVDYAQLIKLYGNSPVDTLNNKYSPAQCTGAKKKAVNGDPELEDVSTSYVERQNLTMRMSMRRFTRLTNGFSKKIDNHIHMLSLYFVHYNFCRKHKTLGTSPAVAAGLTPQIRDMEWVIGLVNAAEPPPKKRGRYKKSSK